MVSVLLVEDEPQVAALACDALTDAGFSVTVAHDDAAACRTLAREARSFAAVVTDINLGAGVTGFDIARLARQLNGAIQALAAEQHRRFLEDAPTTAAQAATIILDGVKADRWRILVGDDAHKMDAKVRAEPEAAYSPEFYEVLVKEMGWRLGR